jgi:integrase
MHATIMLAVDTGMRPQELCAARCQNLNRKTRCLRIPESDAKTAGGLVSYGQTTAEALSDDLDARAGTTGAGQTDRLFLNSRGQPLTHRHWHRLPSATRRGRAFSKSAPTRFACSLPPPTFAWAPTRKPCAKPCATGTPP